MTAAWPQHTLFSRCLMGSGCGYTLSLKKSYFPSSAFQIMLTLPYKDAKKYPIFGLPNCFVFPHCDTGFLLSLSTTQWERCPIAFDCATSTFCIVQHMSCLELSFLHMPVSHSMTLMCYWAKTCSHSHKGGWRGIKVMESKTLWNTHVESRYSIRNIPYN